MTNFLSIPPNTVALETSPSPSIFQHLTKQILPNQNMLKLLLVIIHQYTSTLSSNLQLPCIVQLLTKRLPFATPSSTKPQLWHKKLRPKPVWTPWLLFILAMLPQLLQPLPVIYLIQRLNPLLTLPLVPILTLNYPRLFSSLI